LPVPALTMSPPPLPFIVSSPEPVVMVFAEVDPVTEIAVVSALASTFSKFLTLAVSPVV